MAIEASTYTGSLSVTSAWSGVLVVIRRIWHTSRVVASKSSIEGYGVVRFQNV